MWKSIIVSSFVGLMAMSAHAARFSADHFGITPETGYLAAVTSGEQCDQKTDLLLHDQCYSDQCFHQFIYKCDSTIVGWVEKKANGAALESDDFSTKDPYDFKLMLNTGNDSFGNPEYINIYTCGDSRNDDLAKDPKYTASRDAVSNYNKLMYIKDRKLNFKIQLFYNEFVHSGKCIAGIEITN
jgi:hypothetical protein